MTLGKTKAFTVIFYHKSLCVLAPLRLCVKIDFEKVLISICKRMVLADFVGKRVSPIGIKLRLAFMRYSQSKIKRNTGK